ncbi:hypothetical protein [Kitasatospora sp. NBC_01287]|uniref:hypothetical protein n=1 Tax=Kitasatospora sp. NBC_01287 TaxID=2903573 RepID=UPI00224F1013|nr:hypothetical protein [Kitasatospora sp. NBC_01287]
MRRRLVPTVLLGSALTLGLGLATTGSASAAAARPPITYVSYDQCVAGGGQMAYVYLEGVVCSGGTYDGQWIAGGPLG